MKKRQFSHKNFIQSSTEPTTSSFNDLHSESEYDPSRDGRVCMLSDESKASVRAGQVIGTLPRAIEELVRNSILHGRSTNVDVTIGTVRTQNEVRATTTLLEVKDNGTGIDVHSTQNLIGVKYCSSHASSSSNNSSRSSSSSNRGSRHIDSSRERNGDGADDTSNHQVYESLKGETLKSLAALSVEFRITTASLVPKAKNERQKKNGITQQSKTYAPTKLRKRKFSNDCCQNGGPKCSDVIVCEKIIKEKGNISFNKSICKSRDSPFAIWENRAESNGQSSGTGTMIQVYGLFHSFAVRKRQFEINSNSTQNVSQHRIVLSQAQNCLQLLAMAFPHVSIRLFSSDVMSSQIESSWSTLSSTNPLSLYNSHISMCKNSIKHRLLQLCGEKIISQGTFTDIDYLEGKKSSRKRQKFDNVKTSRSNSTMLRSCWQIQGLLCCKEKGEEKVETNIDNSGTRSRQQELIFVNGKLLKQNSIVGDLIQKYIITTSSSKFLSLLTFIVTHF